MVVPARQAGVDYDIFEGCTLPDACVRKELALNLDLEWYMRKGNLDLSVCGQVRRNCFAHFSGPTRVMIGRACGACRPRVGFFSCRRVVVQCG